MRLLIGRRSLHKVALVPFLLSPLWGSVLFCGRGVFGDEVLLPNGNACVAGSLDQQSCYANNFDINAYRDERNQQYEQLADVLKRHYQAYWENSSFHRDSEHHHSSNVNLSPKVDSSLVRSQQYKNQTKLSLNVHNLTRIVAVNPKDLTVTVQARCTFDALVRETLRHNAIPLVVPEFKSITVGGAIVGGALESSSFQYGQVSDTAVSLQVLLANGTLANVTAESHPELYHALPGSYGSLAIVLEATLQIRRIPSLLVAIQATSFPSLREGMQELLHIVESGSVDSSKQLEERPFSFIDAIHYPSGEFIIFTADFPSSNHSIDETMIIRTEDSSSLWFYEAMYERHMMTHPQNSNKGLLSPLKQFTVYMPIYDYLFRYERGAFWMGRPLQFSWTAIRENPMLIIPFLVSWRRTRWFFGRIFTATLLYRVLHQLDGHAVAEKFLIQDAYIPTENVTRFVETIHQTIPLSVPIWLCPVKRPTATQPLSPSGNFDGTSQFRGSNHSTTTLVNVGVWGRVSDGNGVQYMKELEAEVLRLGGRKMLYSITAASQMTAETLYAHHVDGGAYHALRSKYGANGVFTPLHEKFQLVSEEEQSTKWTPIVGPRRWKYWLSRYLL